MGRFFTTGILLAIGIFATFTIKEIFAGILIILSYLAWVPYVLASTATLAHVAWMPFSREYRDMRGGFRDRGNDLIFKVGLMLIVTWIGTSLIRHFAYWLAG